MKRRFPIRLLLSTLAVSMLLPCTASLVGCQPTDSNNPDESTGGAETAAPIYFTSGGASEYRLIRPETTPDSVRRASMNLRDAVKAATGVAVPLEDDWVAKDTDLTKTAPEILIGLTNRPESIAAHAKLKEKEYSISVVGKRLVIVGYDSDATVAAVDAFITDILGYSTETDSYRTTELVLTGDYSLTAAMPKVYLDQYDKSSLSYYLDDRLTCTEQTLLTFDDPKDYPGSTHADNKEATGSCIGFTAAQDNGHWSLINTPTDSFKLNVTNKFTQTVKLRVYINDIDLLGCDHDSVYDHPQEGSGTLWITFSERQNGVGHSWQHTFYGSGWHELELSFTCHNVKYDNLSSINYENLTSLSVWGIAKAGLEVRFEDMRLCTYENPSYTEPEAPNGGRWLSTCDYEALDGPILTEWYGSRFDTEEKTQGSSSIRITGHKENVDHRVCIGVKDVPVSYNEDTLCFDMYISDLDLLGTNWQIRLEHNAQAAHYFVNYAILSQYAVDENGNSVEVKNGWNHFRLPFNATRVSIGEAYKDQFTNDLTLTQLMFFIEGTGATDAENYLIRYDNFYVTKTSNLK